MKIIADDFGLSPNVDSAIIDLASNSLIHGASVMVNFANSDRCRELQNSSIQIGLHLTDLHLLSSKSIAAQFLNFEKLFKKNPDFIDGHMHLHVYPFASDNLLELLSQENLNENTWIRTTKIHPILLKSAPPVKLPYLKWINFNGIKLQRKLHSYGIKTNSQLWGSFANHTSIDKYFDLFINYGESEDVLFAHPGLTAEHSINRKNEYLFLKNRKSQYE